MALYISKSKYCSAVQCPKMLWLKKNWPEEFDCSVMNQAVLTAGNEVGDLAMGLFGDFKEVPYSDDLGEMMRTTGEWIRAGVPVIAEASFSYEGQFCSVDILKNPGGNRVEMYEVKSSASVKDIYYHDAAYQYYVLKKLGYDVRKVCLVHINSSYVRSGELDLGKLFAVEDVTDKAIELYDDVGKRIAFLEKYMEQAEEPADSIGPNCFKPYACGFWDYCTRDLPHPNVFDVGGLQAGSKFKLYKQGVISFEQIAENGTLKEETMLQIRHELSDLPPKIDRAVLKEFLDSLYYPLYFLDFETFQSAVPLFDDASPYEQIPFQYSLHYIEKEGGECRHKEFLAEPEGDPRRAVAESLCRIIPENVCVIAYNMSFEKGRIKRLAGLYPDLAEHLMSIYDRIRDLMIPFKNKAY